MKYLWLIFALIILPAAFIAGQKIEEHVIGCPMITSPKETHDNALELSNGIAFAKHCTKLKMISNGAANCNSTYLGE